MPPRAIKHQLTCPIELTSGGFLTSILVIPRNRLVVLVKDLFRSKGSIANCKQRACVHAGNATEQFLHHNETQKRAYVHTGNVTEQFLHHNETLTFVHTVPEQLLLGDLREKIFKRA